MAGRQDGTFGVGWSCSSTDARHAKLTFLEPTSFVIPLRHVRLYEACLLEQAYPDHGDVQ